jgi:hypothetical protein
MALLSETQQRDLLIFAGLADFLVGGKLTATAKKAVIGAIKMAMPVAKPVARGVGQLALRGGTAVAPATLPLYGGYLGAEMARRQYMEGGLEQALSNIPLGYPITPTVAEELGLLGSPLSPTVDVYTPAVKVKKRVSAYARNVGRAMKAIKASVKGGKKGKLSNPKKTFSTVSKTVSKIMKGGTRPRSGIGSVISKAVKGTFKRRKAKRKKKRSGKAQYTFGKN